MKKEQQENLVSLEKRVFSNINGKLFIGGEEIKPDIKSILKDQAKYIETSQFYEILNATIVNESARLAWESQNWDNVQYSKALLYWNTVMKKMIKSLSK